MNKTHLLRAASSLALVAAMSTAALSQAPGGPPSGGAGAQEKQAPTQGERANPGPGGTTEMPKSRDGASERPSRPQASDRAQEKANPKSAVQDDDKGDQRRSRAAEERGKDKGDNARAASDRGKDKDDNPRAASDRAKDGKQQSRDGDQDQRRTFGERDGKDGRADRSAQGKDQDKDQRKSADTKRGDAGDRVQISEQKRTSVRERLSKHGRQHHVDRVNFNIRVGVSVPRSVTLHTLPADVVAIVPEYRSYRYVYVGDQYLIIDPNDYVIVAVIGGDSRTAGRRGGSFTLAAEDRVYFRRHVDRGPSIRLGLGGISIGMSLPDSVELRPVPATVVERVPSLRGHRYFFYENEIAIVDPDTRQIVYVIED